MRKITRFFREAYTELRKVVWPTRRRTARLTVMVAVVAVVMSGFLASIDYGLGKGIKQVIDNTQQPGDETQPAAPTGPDQSSDVQTLPQTVPDPTQPQPAQQPPTQ